MTHFFYQQEAKSLQPPPPPPVFVLFSDLSIVSLAVPVYGEISGFIGIPPAVPPPAFFGAQDGYLPPRRLRTSDIETQVTFFDLGEFVPQANRLVWSPPAIPQVPLVFQPPEQTFGWFFPAIVPPPPPSPPGFPFADQDLLPGISCGMAINEVGLANMALTLIGEQPILSFTEDNNPARFICHNYENIRDMVLRVHPWSCAIKRVTLAKLVETPAWGFASVFQLPEDFIRLAQTEDWKFEYRIEAGQKLYSDEGAMNVAYVFRLTDVSKMDPLLQNAIQYRLAAALAIPLTQNEALATQLLRNYAAFVKEAQDVDTIEGPIEVIQSTSWVEQRANFPFSP